MKSSIRKFMLINLLLVMTITTTLTSIGHYYLYQKYTPKIVGMLYSHTHFYDYLYIVLISFPLTGLLIWIIIGKGLNSLNRVAQEVADRVPSHLEPVNIKNAPEEIAPVIDELNKLFYRLKEGFEREKRFAADAAHELRTPLAALKAQAQIALNTNNIDEKNQALQKLLTSVNRSTHIVQQLLIMSKLVPEEANINDLNTVNLPKITREILAMLAPAAVENLIELEFEHDNNTLMIAGNSTAISILIRNLVDNAIRYCKPNGRVAVQVYKEKHEIVLEVRDNGPGIPKELHTRVFERFFRVLGNKSPGSGLGLAIVQQITSLHNGRIVLDSPKHDTGLIIKVYFPALSKIVK
ncbi:ATP-binding protein [bacterium]|nr:ATP-binding protein [bacterium]